MIKSKKKSKRVIKMIKHKIGNISIQTNKYKIYKIKIRFMAKVCKHNLIRKQTFQTISLAIKDQKLQQLLKLAYNNCKAMIVAFNSKLKNIFNKYLNISKINR